jgi:hypothetical protein
MNQDFSSSAGEFVQDLGSAVRENPVSAALIGMGLVWLMTGAGNPLTRAQKLARRTGMDRLPDVAADAFSSSRDAISSGFDAVTEGASSLASRASHGVQKLGAMGSFAPERGSELVSGLKDNLSDLFERQPLFLGAVGIAIGAGIAASIPATDFEADLLGQTSDDLRQQASRFVSEQKENATNIAYGVATAVQEEAKAQGLTVDGLQGAASDTLHKLQNVAATASESVKERLASGVSAVGKSS